MIATDPNGISSFINGIVSNVEDEKYKNIIFDPLFVDYISALHAVGAVYRKRSKQKFLPHPDKIEVVGKRRKQPGLRFFFGPESDVDEAILNDSIKELGVLAMVQDFESSVVLEFGTAAE